MLDTSTMRVRCGAVATIALTVLMSSVAFGQTKPATPAPTTTSPAPAAAPAGTASPTGTAKPTAAPAPAPGATGTGTTASPTATTPAPGAPAGSPTTVGDPAAPAEGAGATVDPEQMPTNLRLRRLEQRVQALKERAWRAKARVGMLKEAVLGGGVGAQATLVHVNKMGTTFRLIKLVYALDGTQVFSRADDPATTLYKSKSIDILSGPIAPGSHTVSVVAEYRGHGYGVFKYLTKYTFTVRSSHTFTIGEGKGTKIEAIAYEKGGATTPLEQRPNIEFKVSQLSSSGN
jgi:hypothetical protein